VILPELHLGRDAPLGVALLLHLMHEGQAAIDFVVSRFPAVRDREGQAGPAGCKPLDAVYAALKAAFPDAEADTQDGLRLSWADKWVHMRPSGTEPIVRVIAEAPTMDGAKALVDSGRRVVGEVGVACRRVPAFRTLPPQLQASYVRYRRIRRPQASHSLLIDGLKRLEYRGYDSRGRRRV
jgi:hypothetical protein